MLWSRNLFGGMQCVRKIPEQVCNDEVYVLGVC